MCFDPVANMSSLKEVFVSRASAKQRQGRAGRVRAGHCWRMYSEAFLEGPDVLEHPLPEMRRIPIEEIILQACIVPTLLLGTFLSLLLVDL